MYGLAVASATRYSTLNWRAASSFAPGKIGQMRRLAQRGLGRHRDLELARAVFGEERVRRRAGATDRGHERLAEKRGVAEGVVAVGGSGAIAGLRQHHLLLEAGAQHEPR